MKLCLDILFTILLFCFYLCTLLLIWLGVFPADDLSTFVGRTEVFVPLGIALAPFLAFFIFLLGYDPRKAVLQRLRGFLLSILKTPRSTGVASAVVLFVIGFELSIVFNLLDRPKDEAFILIIDRDFDAVEAAVEKIESQNDAQLFQLVADAEVEAKRRQSGSDDPNELDRLLKAVPIHDRPFSRVWNRLLASYAMGKLAVCNQDIEGISRSYTRARAGGLGGRIVSHADFPSGGHGLFCYIQRSRGCQREKRTAIKGRATSSW